MNKKGANIPDWTIALVLGLVLLAVVLKFFPGIIIKSADAAHAGLNCGGQQEGYCMIKCGSGMSETAILSGCEEPYECCIENPGEEALKIEKLMFQAMVADIEACNGRGQDSNCLRASTTVIQIVKDKRLTLVFRKQADQFTYIELITGRAKFEHEVLDEASINLGVCGGDSILGDDDLVELYYHEGVVKASKNNWEDKTFKIFDHNGWGTKAGCIKILEGD